jgi:hypothetical protein
MEPIGPPTAHEPSSGDQDGGRSGADAADGDDARAAWPGQQGVSALGPVGGGRRQVLLRMETMTASHTRQLLGTLAVARDASAAAVIALVAVRLRGLPGAQRPARARARVLARKSRRRQGLLLGPLLPGLSVPAGLQLWPLQTRPTAGAPSPTPLEDPSPILM